MQNFKVINNYNVSNNICYIFFSSNGIVNDTRSMDYVIKNDYYEFINVASSNYFKKPVRKIIFVRDLSLNFYVNGINDECGSIDEILKIIRKETIGMKITAIGYSSGGYMATLISLFLDNVHTVLSFGGVLNIYSWRGSKNDTSFLENKVVFEASKFISKEKYFNLLPFLLDKKKTTPIFYFYGDKSICDLSIISEKNNYEISNFYCIPVPTNIHGGLLTFFDYVALFKKNNRSLIRLSKCKIKSRQLLSLKIQGPFAFLLNKYRNYIWQKKRYDD